MSSYYFTIQSLLTVKLVLKTDILTLLAISILKSNPSLTKIESVQHELNCAFSQGMFI